jgi:hypothetical protein
VRVRGDAGSARPWRPGAPPTLFVAGRLHAAGYDEPTLAAALEHAMEKR